MLNARGTITSAHGRHYLVQLENGNRITAFPKGKKSDFVCGDICHLELLHEEGWITSVEDRSSLLWRSDQYKQKMIAANVTMAMIVSATDLPLNLSLINRCILACEHQKIRPILILNKIDLGDSAHENPLEPFSKLGYRSLSISAKNNIDNLRTMIQGERVVFVGTSGVGKTTIINNLVPDAKSKTGEISRVLNSGKHTTTHATLYQVNEETSLIDCPGIQAFGLHHIHPEELVSLFKEFSPYLGNCQFSDCSHIAEPGCKVQDAVSKDLVSSFRWEQYKQLRREVSDTSHWK
ncbi:MAG: ribosome small subunit-dependent GTPase A [Betaproteobacteria bacterium]